MSNNALRLIKKSEKQVKTTKDLIKDLEAQMEELRSLFTKSDSDSCREHNIVIDRLLL